MDGKRRLSIAVAAVAWSTAACTPRQWNAGGQTASATAGPADAIPISGKTYFAVTCSQIRKREIWSREAEYRQWDDLVRTVPFATQDVGGERWVIFPVGRIEAPGSALKLRDEPAVYRFLQVGLHAQQPQHARLAPNQECLRFAARLRAFSTTHDFVAFAPASGGFFDRRNAAREMVFETCDAVRRSLNVPQDCESAGDAFAPRFGDTTCVPRVEETRFVINDDRNEHRVWLRQSTGSWQAIDWQSLRLPEGWMRSDAGQPTTQSPCP